jgi:hypothetical protein
VGGREVSVAVVCGGGRGGWIGSRHREGVCGVGGLHGPTETCGAGQVPQRRCGWASGWVQWVGAPLSSVRQYEYIDNTTLCFQILPYHF